MKVKKRFNIGEYAIGGIIEVDISKQMIIIKALDYNTKKEIKKHYIELKSMNVHDVLDDILHDLTSSYYADIIKDWIETKCDIPGKLFTHNIFK